MSEGIGMICCKANFFSRKTIKNAAKSEFSRDLFSSALQHVRFDPGRHSVGNPRLPYTNPFSIIRCCKQTKNGVMHAKDRREKRTVSSTNDASVANCKRRRMKQTLECSLSIISIVEIFV
jgi:hypothetical protein